MDNSCSICLEYHDEYTIKLNCNHIYHKKCLAKLNKYTCPLCRKKIDIYKIFNLCTKLKLRSCENEGYSPLVNGGECRVCFGNKLENLI